MFFCSLFFAFFQFFLKRRIEFFFILHENVKYKIWYKLGCLQLVPHKKNSSLYFFVKGDLEKDKIGRRVFRLKLILIERFKIKT